MVSLRTHCHKKPTLLTFISAILLFALASHASPVQKRDEAEIPANLATLDERNEPARNFERDGTPKKQKGKMMIVGDSISHGMEGDYTWRGRLADWMRNEGHDIEFVGPLVGTSGNQFGSNRPTPPNFYGQSSPSGPYVRGAYHPDVPANLANGGHGSRWGQQAAQVRDPIKQWCRDHQPDWLLLLLGFNDLGWFVSDADGLLGTMGNLVQHCREEKPNVILVIGNVVDRTRFSFRQDLIDKTIEYNRKLATTMPNWFRWESPLFYVDVNSNYNCKPDNGCPAGWDGLHPAASGEWQIAQAFARVLRDNCEFTGNSFELPGSIPGKQIVTPGELRLSSVPEGFYMSWDQSLANPRKPRSYNLRTRPQGWTDWWWGGGISLSGREMWSTWIFDGQTWEFQVQAQGDRGQVSDWSYGVLATAHPQTAPGPPNIGTFPFGSDGILYTWNPIAGFSVDRYAVFFWDVDEPGSWVGANGAVGTSVIIPGFVPGHRYSLWVSTWVNLPGGPAGGIPSGARDVRVGVEPPGPPTSISARNLEPTTVELSWPGIPRAAGYAVYSRPITGGTFQPAGTTASTTMSIAWVFPGTWNFQFCVSAYNGNLESAAAACVVPPKWPGFKRAETAASVNESVPAFNPSGIWASASENSTALNEMWRHFNFTENPEYLPRVTVAEVS